MQEHSDKSILFYDGVCVLCDGLIRFLIRVDKKNKLLFSALQTEQSERVLKPFGLEPKNLESIVLLHENEVFVKSRAVIKMLQLLPCNLLSFMLIGKILPGFINDLIYNTVAKVRYSIFGTRESCRIPSPHEQSRFLS